VSIQHRTDLPAMLGGPPAFPEGLPFLRPSVPDEEAVVGRLRTILRSGMLTNGPFVRELEERAAAYLRVKHCVAVSNCTAGLMLALQAADLSGDVVLPSFTFAATAHAVAWNQLRPVFADVDPGTLTLSPEAAAGAVGVRTSAILATHTFGTPCEVEELSALARSNGVKLVFDAAHAFGSRRNGVPVGGFGEAEVFSLSPTKVLVASEGGLIATNDDEIAERCRIGRDYANPGDYDCLFVGLNARMSEIHAAFALASLEDLDQRVERRNELAALYRQALGDVSGIRFPTVAASDRSTYKDFTIMVEAEGFGIEAARLAEALLAEGIQTKRYYAPPVHTMRAYRSQATHNGHLPVTEAVATQVLTLPLWSSMEEPVLRRVADTVRRIHLHRKAGGRDTKEPSGHSSPFSTN
jgi:dTDP-4-amino-4,6-dideoxygalactose transaminase